MPARDQGRQYESNLVGLPMHNLLNVERELRRELHRMKQALVFNRALRGVGHQTIVLKSPLPVATSFRLRA